MAYCNTFTAPHLSVFIDSAARCSFHIRNIYQRSPPVLMGGNQVRAINIPLKKNVLRLRGAVGGAIIGRE